MSTNRNKLFRLLASMGIKPTNSVTQIANCLGLIPRTLVVHITNGNLKAHKIGRGYSVKLEWLVAFFETVTGEALLDAALHRKANVQQHEDPGFSAEELATEVWRNLPKGLLPLDWLKYEASNLGRVVRCVGGKGARAGKLLKIRYAAGGYGSVSIGGKNRDVQRLVALIFLPNPDDLPQVHHKDGNRRNNRASNLEWCTAAENMKAAKSDGQAGRPDGRPGTTLTPDQVADIKTKRLSAIEFARLYPVNVREIYRIWNGERWADVRPAGRKIAMPDAGEGLIADDDPEATAV
ncbi:MAG: HNH endonuclease [Planctomycetes bacterium]|nr:HNH endonuclease [Planctomycetota bacterium]